MAVRWLNSEEGGIAAVNVGADFVAGEGAVEEAKFIDQAVEGHVVAGAGRARVIADGNAAGDVRVEAKHGADGGEAGCLKFAVEVEPHFAGLVIKNGGEVGPGLEWNRGGEGLRGAPAFGDLEMEEAILAQGEENGVERGAVVSAEEDLGPADAVLGAAVGFGEYPRLKRKGAEKEGGGIGDLDGIIEAIEMEGLAQNARREIGAIIECAVVGASGVEGDGIAAPPGDQAGGNLGAELPFGGKEGELEIIKSRVVAVGRGGGEADFEGGGDCLR